MPSDTLFSRRYWLQRDARRRNARVRARKAERRLKRRLRERNSKTTGRVQLEKASKKKVKLLAQREKRMKKGANSARAKAAEKAEKMAAVRAKIAALRQRRKERREKRSLVKNEGAIKRMDGKAQKKMQAKEGHHKAHERDIQR